MNSKFDSSTLGDFVQARSLEWIETNGLGGYASGTASGAHSRRYHGLLVAALHPPVGRMVLVSKLDETIVLGSDRFDLGSNQYPGAVHPEGFRHLTKFERGLFPEFTYQVGSVKIRKTVAALYGENTTLIRYEVLEAKEKFLMELLPLYSCRDFHSLSHANDAISTQYLFHEGQFRMLNYQGCPEVFIDVPGATFAEHRDWYYNFEYSIEQYRGLDFKEDLYTHGKFQLEATAGSSVVVVISAEDTRGRDGMKLFEGERNRRQMLVDGLAGISELKRLALAADQFIVKRGDLKTIIAGYHWFSDWGRDTMISLPGLCLVTGRLADAKNILLAFSKSVSEGMLPNRFPDYGESLEYNTIDATLWFFHAIYKYYQYSKDLVLIETLWPVLKEIIEWHDKGTRYGIHVDSTDGLLYGGQDGVQLTWMDAKVGDWVVTPRKGKPVEINALWYNALAIMDFFARTSGRSEESATFQGRAEKVLKSFNSLFWNEDAGCLFDCLEGDFRDASIRPNQIYALALPFPLVSKTRGASILKVIKNKLLTTRGLRSLDPQHASYCPEYGGDPWHRDGAYHQGTVWSFLLGPYVDALIFVQGEKGKAEAREVLQEFFNHLNEAGVGTVSEIFDAAPPHTPRGCMAQAWGVAEILRSSVEHALFQSSQKK